jgi:phage baseplate assembly protein V
MKAKPQKTSAGQSSLHFGRVSALKPETCEARVKLQDMDGLETYWLKVLQPKTKGDRAYWMPDLDQPCAVMLDEKGEAGVILGGVYSESDAPPISSPDRYHIAFSDGTTIDYDRSTSTLAIEGPVQVTIKADRIDWNP